MLADKFVHSVWEYLASKKLAVLHLAARRNININLDAKTFAIGSEVSADPIELIEAITPSEYGTNDAIDQFFKTIGEQRIIDREATSKYLEAKGASSYLLSFLGPAIGLSADMSMIMPSTETIKERLGPLADKFTFLVPEGGIYAGNKAWLHITAYGVLSAVTVKAQSGYVTIKPDFMSAPTPFGEHNLLAHIHTGKREYISIDAVKHAMASVFPGVRYEQPLAPVISIDESAKPGKIDALFESCDLSAKRVFIGDRPLHKWLVDYIVRHKGWQAKLESVANILSTMNSIEFNLLMDAIGKHTPTGKRVTKMRLYGSTNVLGALGIEPVAKICCNINAPSDILVSIRGTIETIPIAEQARQQFMSRGDLKKEIDGLRNMNARITSVDDKSVLSMAFDALRDAADSLPSITNVAYDGIWKFNEKYIVVAKGSDSDYIEAMNSGFMAQAKFVHFKETGRRHERNLVRRVPQELAEAYAVMLDVLFGKKKGAIFSAIDKASANALASHLMSSCSFVRKISLSRFTSITKQLYNTRLVLLFIEHDIDKAREVLSSIDGNEFLGIKKEHGILFEPRNTSSAIGICIDEEFGDDYSDIARGDNLLDDICATIIEAKNQQRRLAYFKRLLENKVFS